MKMIIFILRIIKILLKKIRSISLFNGSNIYYFLTSAVLIVSILLLTKEKIINYPYCTIDNFKEMVTVTESTVSIEGKGDSGIFTKGKTITLDPYRIGKYEVSFAYWQEVYDWIKNESPNKYQFHSLGQPGIYMSYLADPEAPYIIPELQKIADKSGKSYKKVKSGFYPATKMTWGDTIVWCNALSEKEGLDPVYYSKGQVLRNALDITHVESPTVMLSNNGYRLPTEAEWEFAARGGNVKADDWDFIFAGTDSLEDVDEYTWYKTNSPIFFKGFSGEIIDIHPIGQKKPNKLGLYDMSGNCWEWCFDLYNSRSKGNYTNPLNDTGIGYRHRIIKSGSVKHALSYANVKSWGYAHPVKPGYILGFRLAQSIPKK